MNFKTMQKKIVRGDKTIWFWTWVQRNVNRAKYDKMTRWVREKQSLISAHFEKTDHYNLFHKHLKFSLLGIPLFFELFLIYSSSSIFVVRMMRLCDPLTSQTRILWLLNTVWWRQLLVRHYSWLVFPTNKFCTHH